MVRIILIKSPDEWTTTKQACRDDLVVHLFFSLTTYTSLCFYVLSTVLRRSNFTLYIYIYIYISVQWLQIGGKKCLGKQFKNESSHGDILAKFINQ